MAAHIVGDKRYGNVIFHQFPRGEASTLQVRPRLVGDDRDMFALIDSTANDTESRAPNSSGRECSRVTMRQNSGIVCDHFPAKFRDHALGLDILVVDLFRLGLKDSFDLEYGLALGFRSPERDLHPVDRPKKIYCRRARFAEDVSSKIEFFFEIGDRRTDKCRCGQCHSVCRRNTDRRGSSDDHILDALCDIIIRLQEQPFFFGR